MSWRMAHGAWPPAHGPRRMAPGACDDAQWDDAHVRALSG
jgi:hypothetical protein